MEIILTNANSGDGDSVFPGDSVIKNPPANTGAMVWSLIQEDPTCQGATNPCATTIKLVL